VQGFEVIDVKTGLDEKQCRLALKRIALLHSTSMALQELEPETALRIKSLMDKSFPETVSPEAYEDWRSGYIRGLGKDCTLKF